MANDGTVKIGTEIDDSGVKKGTEKLKKDLSGLVSALKDVDKALELDPGNIDLITEKQKLLQGAVSAAADEYNRLQKEVDSAKSSGLAEKDADAYRKLVIQLAEAKAEFNRLESELNSAEKGLDDVGDSVKDAGKELDDASEKTSKFSEGLKRIGSVAGTGLKATGALIAGVGTAAAGAVGGLLALESATEEYRIAQGKLNTAFEAAGYSMGDAQQAYRDFYGILGDVDTATEASQLLAKLSNSQEDLSTWTRTAAGVWGTFGDSLPIEGLIEASNETAKTGTVVGVLADALNWAGISEDEFNEKLAVCSDESERNQLIMDTLSSTYDEASDAFYRNNEALVQARENQALLDETMSNLSTTVSDVKNNLMSEFLPSISNLADAFGDLITGVDGADVAFSDAVSDLIQVGVQKLPEFMAFGGQILVSIISGLVQSLPLLVAAVPQISSALLSSIFEMGPDLMASGSTILSMLYDGIMQAIPMLSEGAASLMTSLGEYLEANLPTLLEKGLEAVVALTDSIRENAGVIVDGALGLAESLAKGLVDSIPTIVQNVPTIVSNIANVINDNAPKVFASAVKIIGTLVSGLIKSIPTIVQNLPKIINAIVNVFLAFNWLNLGKNIINGLGNGIKSMVSGIKNIANQVVQAIKGGISGLPSQMATIGKNIVQGLWNGIKGMGSWLTSQVKNFFGGIVSGVKNFLGIHSPSTVFAEMGKFSAQGYGVGWDKNIDKVKRDMENSMDFEKTLTFNTVQARMPSIQSAMSAMVPPATYSVATASAVGTDKTVGVLEKILVAIKEGKIIMVDKQVLGKVTSSAQKNNAKAMGV